MKPTPNDYLKCPFFTSWNDYCGDGDELEPKDSGKCDFMEDEQCSDTEHPCVCSKCYGSGWCWREEVDEDWEHSNKKDSMLFEHWNEIPNRHMMPFTKFGAKVYVVYCTIMDVDTSVIDKMVFKKIGKYPQYFIFSYTESYAKKIFESLFPSLSTEKREKYIKSGYIEMEGPIDIKRYLYLDYVCKNKGVIYD